MFIKNIYFQPKNAAKIQNVITNNGKGYNITLYNYDETGKVIGETSGIVSCANINYIALQTPDEYIPTTTKQYEYTFSGTQTTYSQYIQGKEEVYTIKRSKSEFEKAKSYVEIMNSIITTQKFNLMLYIRCEF